MLCIKQTAPEPPQMKIRQSRAGSGTAPSPEKETFFINYFSFGLFLASYKDSDKTQNENVAKFIWRIIVVGTDIAQISVNFLSKRG